MRITSAAHNGSDAATGADHGRSSQVNACVYTHRYVYILYQPRRGTFQKHPRISWSHESSCFAPGVIWHRVEDGKKRRQSRKG